MLGFLRRLHDDVCSICSVALDSYAIPAGTTSRKSGRVIRAHDECISIGICEVVGQRGSLADIGTAIYWHQAMQYADRINKRLHSTMGRIRYSLVREVVQEVGAHIVLRELVGRRRSERDEGDQSKSSGRLHVTGCVGMAER
jgi:hypothetical protein